MPWQPVHKCRDEGRGIWIKSTARVLWDGKHSLWFRPQGRRIRVNPWHLERGSVNSHCRYYCQWLCSKREMSAVVVPWVSSTTLCTVYPLFRPSNMSSSGKNVQFPSNSLYFFYFALAVIYVTSLLCSLSLFASHLQWTNSFISTGFVCLVFLTAFLVSVRKLRLVRSAGQMTIHNVAISAVILRAQLWTDPLIAATT